MHGESAYTTPTGPSDLSPEEREGEKEELRQWMNVCTGTIVAEFSV